MEKQETKGKFEKIKPIDGMELAEYLKSVKDTKIPNEYYVPYNVEYGKSAIINYYADNRTNYLAVEYEVPNEDITKEKEHVKLIIAKRENTIGDSEKVRNILRLFFNNSSKYSTIESIDPIAYIATLQKMGWEFTEEGIELMQVTKVQGDVEIKRTQFTDVELEIFSRSNQLEDNIRQHIDKNEKDIIEGIKKYIVETYQQIPCGLTPELDRYKKKVQQYVERQKQGEESKKYLLEAMFDELKPLKESTSIIPLLQKSYNQNIEGYLNMMPNTCRDIEIHNQYIDYIRIREIAISEKENNNKELPENSVAKANLAILVEKMDQDKEKIAKVKRKKIQDKVSKKIRLSNGEIEIA